MRRLLLAILCVFGVVGKYGKDYASNKTGMLVWMYNEKEYNKSMKVRSYFTGLE